MASSVPVSRSRWNERVRGWLRRSPLRRVVVGCRHFGLDPRDVMLASYPKSGNTWLKAMLGFVLSGKELENFRDDNEFVPSVGYHRSARRSLPEGGRLVKTHEPYRDEYQRAILLLRDGRDVAVSRYHYRQRQGEREVRFSDYLADELAGRAGANYGTWPQHTRSWLTSPLAARGDLFLVRYEDVKQDAVKELRRMCDFLNLTPDEALVEAAVDACSLDRMRAKESQGAHQSARNASIPFARKGAVGDWRGTFSEEDCRAFDAAAGDLLRRLGYAPSGVSRNDERLA